MNNKIVVVGAGGQLGLCVRDISTEEDNIVFLTHKDLDITNKEDVFNLIQREQPKAVINCAAYVDIYGAEYNIFDAYNVNCLGAMYLAEACNSIGAKFIHISTDYVFDGESNVPYKETDVCRPLNFYGVTKYLGELTALKSNPDSIVIRTSWLYSWYGNNFLTKVIKKLDSGDKFRVVYDVIGAPTYAFDLAEFIMSIIRTEKCNDMRGVYQYANSGAISRYDFAAEIERLYFGSRNLVQPCLSSTVVDTVKRPVYAVFDKTKAEAVFEKPLPDWKDSLKKCFEKAAPKKSSD